MTKARTLADNFAADINGITAGTGITGGGTSGTVTITNEMATTITAKGDLLAGTGNAAFDNLAAGASGETLVADSSTSTGLRYNPQNALANPVINGGMDIWQRGTSGTANSYAAGSGYNADRWNNFASGTAITVSRQATSDTTNLPNIQYCARVQRNSGQTSTSVIYHTYNQETVNSIPLSGKAVTLSFYARAGSNFSASSSLLTAKLISGTGTDQTVLNGYTGQTQLGFNDATLTTSWQRFVVTGTMGATATQFAVVFQYTPTGTASTNDYFEVTGVQIDLGTYTASSAPTFRRSGGTLAGELAACQRYFWRISSGSGNNYQKFALGHFQTTTVFNFILPLRASMRTTPSISTSGSFTVHQGQIQKGTAAPTLQGDGSGSEVINLNATVASATEGYAGYIRAENSTSTNIDISAEL